MTVLRGCGTALVTPFTSAGALDLPRLEALVEWQVSQGIDFLVPCGSTGEAATMTPAERARVTATVVRVARGRVPVMAGATDNDTTRAVDEAQRQCDAGASLILSACPFYNKPTPAGLVRHFTAIADAVGVPVVLYNIPGRTGVNMLPATVAELARHPRIRGIKESSGDLRQVQQLLAMNLPDLAVLSGDDWIALAAIAHGAHGLVSVTANEVPALVHGLVHAALEGRIAEARALHVRLQPVMDANFLESNPAPVKAALALMGRIENVVRLPLVPVRQDTLDQLRQAVAAVVDPGHPLASRLSPGAND